MTASGPASGRRPLGGRATTVVLAVLIVGLFVTATATAVMRRPGGRVAIPAAGQVPGPAPASTAEIPVPAAPAPVPRTPVLGTPLRIRIPVIGAEAGLNGLSLNADGTLEVPPYDRAGWYKGAAKPGELGPAVVVAHVDSQTGPAVFYRLKALKSGDTVSVDYDDGTTVSFVVQGAERFSKAAFPTERVYGATSQPELRLITCGGSFDRRTRHYLDNLVVWATAAPGQAGTAAQAA